MKGKLITVYGINNIGKSTHCKKLVERLNTGGRSAVYVKFPIYDLDPSGPFLDGVLRGENGQTISESELQLWFVLNRYQFEPEINKLLADGHIIVAEDYIGTGIAWGTAKGLETEWLENINKFLIKEDFAILLEGQRNLRAREKRHIHEGNDDLIDKCARVHGNLADRYGWRRIELQNLIEDTAELFWNAVDDFLMYG